MNDQNFEDLAKQYPDLFQKANIDYISVADGWVTLLNVLCNFLSSRVEKARVRLQYAIEKDESVPIWEDELSQALEELPTILQVKEKFGSLRFYISGGTEIMQHYIDFATALSNHTCEKCGSPGKSRNDGWIKVLCDKHYTERENELNSYSPPSI